MRDQDHPWVKGWDYPVNVGLEPLVGEEPGIPGDVRKGPPKSAGPGLWVDMGPGPPMGAELGPPADMGPGPPMGAVPEPNQIWD